MKHNNSQCDHDEVDIDALLTAHPGLQAALDVPFEPEWDLREVQRVIIEQYRLKAGRSASAHGVCAAAPS